MKKIFSILLLILICNWSKAQVITYSQELVNKAEDGDVKAMKDLAYCYSYGKGVTRNYSYSSFWYYNAAKKGDVESMISIGDLFYHEKIHSCDLYNKDKLICTISSSASSWYEKAEKKGSIEAMKSLGDCYKYGKGGVWQSYYNAVSWYKKAAKKGNADAMVSLGKCFFEEGSYTKAISWYKKAIETDNPDAMFYLGQCYYIGKGVTKDESQAISWYQKAAGKGSVEAMYNLADYYHKYFEEIEDKSLAVSWYQKSADKGNVDAMIYLGDCFYKGEGVLEDKSMAVSWYRKATDKGNVNAMIKLGKCYYNGNGITEDVSKTVYWYEKAAGKGSVEAMLLLGDLYYNAKKSSSDSRYIETDRKNSFNQALSWYREAADKGSAKAMNMLGECYINGKGVDKDIKYAEKWFLDAAKRGCTEALNNLITCYYNYPYTDHDTQLFWYNVAVEEGNANAMFYLGEYYTAQQDYNQALCWYEKAVDKGNSEAMNMIGEFYNTGRGVEQDCKQAIYWYEKAAQVGNAKAMSNLGKCYKYGEGVSEDSFKAVFWWKAAAVKGNTDAIKHLANCYINGEGGLERNQDNADVLLSAYYKSSLDEVIKMVYQVFPEMENHKPMIDPNNPPVIQIVPGSIMFVDATGNNAIDANEKSIVRFKVKNIGKGTGYDCVAKVESSGHGITAGEKKIEKIDVGKSIDIEIPVKSNMNTIDGTTNLVVSVYEPNDFGCDPVTLTINTNAYVAPMLKIVDYAISNEGGGNLRKMTPFNLQMILQNTQYGNAEDVEVSISLPDNVMVMEGEKHRTFANMDAGSKKDLSYTIIANNAYTASSIPVKVSIKEKYGKYAESRTISLAMNQQMSANRIVVDENETTPISNIEIAQIKGKVELSDVDQNIPHNATKNVNTFAVIIANENYQNEEKVDFALNDGIVFKKYCEEALGLPSKNIHLVKDATLNNIFAHIDWLKGVADSFTDAKIIFYYAGHGIPDEKTKEAYLLPVDGYGGNTRTGYKLDELYTELSSMPTKQTVVFLDACFSGAQRNGDMMASARSVAITTRKAAPRGNMVVFSGAQGDETAYPYKEKQHGLFTYYLLKKLQMSKGNVTLGDLSSYIITKVKQESVLTNEKSQTPTVNPSPRLNNWREIRLR